MESKQNHKKIKYAKASYEGVPRTAKAGITKGTLKATVVTMELTKT